jgi:hypothetical protein
MPNLVKNRITDQTVKSAHSRDKRYELRDGELRGFMLRVNRNGTKSWYVQLNRTQKRKISDANLMTAAIARYRARDILVANQAAARPRKDQQSTLKLNTYLRGRYTDWKAPMSPWAQRDINRLCNALGELGQMSINELGVSHLERWKLKRVVKVKPATANRELAALRAALNKAISWGLTDNNPAQQVKNARSAGKSTTRVLNDTERDRLYSVLDSGV